MEVGDIIYNYLLIMFLFLFILSFINRCTKMILEKLDDLKNERNARTLEEIYIEEELL